MANTSDGGVELATTTIGVGVGTPVEIRGEITVTQVMTWEDAKRAVYEVLRQAEQAIKEIGRPR